jgi:hypothetical protein
MKLFKVLKNKIIVHEGRRYDFKKDSLVEESVITRIYKDNFFCVGEKIYIQAPFSEPKVIISETEVATSEQEVVSKPETIISEPETATSEQEVVSKPETIISEPEVVINEINNNDERSEIGEQKQSGNSKIKKGN